VWALGAPGARGAGLSIWLVLLGSQFYVVARLALKLQFMASAVALFGAQTPLRLGRDDSSA
jgi:hypothetical protein